MRVTIGSFGLQPDRLQQLEHSGQVVPLPLRDKGFGHDVADLHARVERPHRVLEDQLESLTQESQPPLGQPRDVGAVDLDGASGGLIEAGDDPQQRRLAAAGLPGAGAHDGATP